MSNPPGIEFSLILDDYFLGAFGLYSGGGGMFKRTLLILAVALTGCTSVLKDPVAQVSDGQVNTETEAPKAGTRIKVWATNYYVHSAQHDENGIDLLSPEGVPLERIASQDWCAAAIEGTAIVHRANGTKTFNYASLSREPSVDCRPYVPEKYRDKDWAIALGRTRWVQVNAPYGLGTGGYKLVPFKTVAVDPKEIPIGSVLYIPEAKGIEYEGPDGPQVHDGYFFAADVGGAIKGNHIDVFTGDRPNKVFAFVKSRPSATFDAIVMDDPKIRERLAKMHR